MKILILDNYDSFTYNLVHLVEKVSGHECEVYKNDAIGLEAIDAYHKIILSPGPGLPSQAGIMPQLLQTYCQRKSIFGVCLGLQAIGELAGARLKNLSEVCHGLALPLTTKQDPLFEGCPGSFTVGRYHSWVIDRAGLPANLAVIAEDDGGEIMALRHKAYDLCGVQFHPESILSEHGDTILKNWLNN